MNLEEQFEQRPIVGLVAIVDDLDRLGMVAMVSIRRIRDSAAGIADAGGNDAGLFADQVLHAPETASRQNRAFFAHEISST